MKSRKAKDRRAIQESLEQILNQINGQITVIKLDAEANGIPFLQIRDQYGSWTSSNLLVAKANVLCALENLRWK